MKITILTLFPEVLQPILNTSILKRAQKKGLVTITCVNIRDFATDSRKTVDDKPYGGGVGMILRIDIVHKALENVKCLQPRSAKRDGQMLHVKCRERIILTDPKGETFSQQKAQTLSRYDHLIIIAGHYEGIDARIEEYVDEVVSLGNFILTGGEIPAIGIVDSVVRLLSDVLPKGATATESFEKGLLEYPQYTRPQEFDGKKVPEVLLSGNHKKIEQWKKSMQKKVHS